VIGAANLIAQSKLAKKQKGRPGRPSANDLLANGAGRLPLLQSGPNTKFGDTGDTVMIIWSGLGILVGVVGFACVSLTPLVVDGAMHDAQFSQTHGWPWLLGCWAGR
jgi:hypothetical protein